MSEQLVLKGELIGHSDAVTAISTTPEDESMIVSASRDKTLLVWHLIRDETSYGFPRRALTGHSHFVEDCTISSDGQYCLSGSWDGTLRLWNIHSGETTKRFVGHDKDVLSIAFSLDNRQIVSGSRDRTIRLWNTLGECKYTINGHKEWVSCVRVSPSQTNPLIVSCGWDKLVKVWNLNSCKLRSDLVGHSGFVSSVTISPDGSLCASGGKDGTAILWDLTEGKHLYSLKADDIIHSLVFSPNRYWLCAAVGIGASASIKIWDLESKAIVAELKLAPELLPVGKKSVAPYPISLAWSANGATLFTGWTDSIIRVYQVMQ